MQRKGTVVHCEIVMVSLNKARERVAAFRGVHPISTCTDFCSRERSDLFVLFEHDLLHFSTFGSTSNMADFIMTIDSDVEDIPEPVPQPKKKGQKVDDDAALNPDFVFDLADDTYADILNNGSTTHDLIKTGSKAVCRSSVQVPLRNNLTV